jgi:hypothetical protein
VDAVVGAKYDTAVSESSKQGRGQTFECRVQRDLQSSPRSKLEAGSNGTVLTGMQGEAKAPGASVEGKVGAELSTKEGATIGAAVSGHAGPLSGEIKVDTNGVHTSAQVGGNKDIKLGAHMQIGVGVGVTVNLSQVARAAEHARQSGLALANNLVNKFMPSGPIF